MFQRRTCILHRHYKPRVVVKKHHLSLVGDQLVTFPLSLLLVPGLGESTLALRESFSATK
jgi:hypothetical protein